MLSKILDIEKKLKRQRKKLEMLFTGYNFKAFARAVRRVNPRYKGILIRQLYSGYLYPELPFYLKITEELR